MRGSLRRVRVEQTQAVVCLTNPNLDWLTDSDYVLTIDNTVPL